MTDNAERVAPTEEVRTITVTIEMTVEEAESLVYVVSHDHPGARSLHQKLLHHAERHPAIQAQMKARENR